jgi:ABC-type multidrug transport system permease subunit
MMALSSLVASTTLFISIMTVWKGILTAFLLNGIIYLVILKYTALDKIELYGRFQKAIKKNIDSLNESTQILILK